MWHRAYCRQSGRGAQERTTIAQLVVPKEELPPADAKAQWHTLVAVIAQIDPNQAMYYEACPDNNRKVRPSAHASMPRMPGVEASAAMSATLHGHVFLGMAAQLYMSHPVRDHVHSSSVLI